MTTDELIAAILDLPCKIPPEEAMYGTYLDGVRAAAELVRQYAVSVPQWRPIATAPKDGTHVLIVVPNHWRDGVEVAMPAVTEGWFDSHWKIVWLDIHGCGCCGGSDPEPTHWQPLPAPPEGEMK